MKKQAVNLIKNISRNRNDKSPFKRTFYKRFLTQVLPCVLRAKWLFIKKAGTPLPVDLFKVFKASGVLVEQKSGSTNLLAFCDTGMQARNKLYIFRVAG